MEKIILNFISGKFYAKIGHNTKQMSVWKVQTGFELQILYQIVGTQQSQETSWSLHNLGRLETTVVIDGFAFGILTQRQRALHQLCSSAKGEFDITSSQHLYCRGTREFQHPKSPSIQTVRPG